MPLELVPTGRNVPVVVNVIIEIPKDAEPVKYEVDKVFSGYSHIQDIGQVSSHWLDRIGHFFEHYKDLEMGKWVKLEGWQGVEAARQEILDCVARYNATPDKPPF